MKITRSIVHVLYFALAASPLSMAADRAIYVLAGRAELGFPVPVELYRLGSPLMGAVLVRVIQPADSFTCSISISPQERLLAIVDDKSTEALVNVIDMDRPERKVKVKIDYDAAPGKERSCGNGFLVRSPDGRLLQAVVLGNEHTRFELSAASSDVSGFSLLGVPLRPYASEERVERLPWQYDALIEVSSVGWGGDWHHAVPDEYLLSRDCDAYLPGVF